MKVLQINCVYNKGSTGKIVYTIHTELQKQGISSIICYGRGKKVNEEKVYKTCGEVYSKANNLLSRITGLMYGGCFFSTNKLISIIKKENPGVVHLHCLNGNFVNIYRLISWLKKSKIKTILTLHAEFMHTANCGHAFDCEEWKTGCKNCKRWRKETRSWFFNGTARSWKKMKRAFDGFNNLTVVSVSPWLMERAKQSPILADKKHCVIFNSLDTDIYKIYDTQELRKRHGLTDEKILFHVTPSFSADPEHIKGGYFVLKVAEALKNEKIKILVAGSYSPEIKIPSNMIMLGPITDQTLLARYYSMADVTVLTSKKETFSMICAESLCCGTPIVGFKAGAPEQISIADYSTFVEYGDLGNLKTVILKWLLDKEIKKERIANRAKDSYAQKYMIDKLLDLYQ